ncbi:hypothetical protein [Streptomyces sp. NPDC020951]|uniref:hypothetical protein n=1 Tax=Streptomyces sp. NPDC020951 TaxID=3365104 RepID=UPI003794D7DB
MGDVVVRGASAWRATGVALGAASGLASAGRAGRGLPSAGRAGAGREGCAGGVGAAAARCMGAPRGVERWSGGTGFSVRELGVLGVGAGPARFAGGVAVVVRGAGTGAVGGVVGRGRSGGRLVGAPRPARRRGADALGPTARWTLVADDGGAEPVSAAGELAAGPVGGVGVEPLAATGRVGPTGPTGPTGAGGVGALGAVAARCTFEDGDGDEVEDGDGGAPGAGAEAELVAGAVRCTDGDDVRPASLAAGPEAERGAEAGLEVAPGVGAAARCTAGVETGREVTPDVGWGAVVARCTARGPVRPPSVAAGVAAGAGAGGVAARCTAGGDVRPLSPEGELRPEAEAGGAVAGVASALRAGTGPEARAADDPVRVSAGAGRLLTG